MEFLGVLRELGAEPTGRPDLAAVNGLTAWADRGQGSHCRRPAIEHIISYYREPRQTSVEDSDDSDRGHSKVHMHIAEKEQSFRVVEVGVKVDHGC